MCKELPVIPVNKVVDPKRIIGTKRRAQKIEHMFNYFIIIILINILNHLF
jgi:hypothetical protein